MTIEKNKALARRFVQEVCDEGNLRAIDELVTPNFRIYSPPSGDGAWSRGLQASHHADSRGLV
jgi:hypothetical protein